MPTARSRQHTITGARKARGRHVDYVHGMNYEQDSSLAAIVKALPTTGFQAGNLAHGIEIVDHMIRDRATILLSFTANIVSSGLREAITFLARHRLVHAIVTSGGGVEEDIIKCLGGFRIEGGHKGNMDETMRSAYRIGNIRIGRGVYQKFQRSVMPVLRDVYRHDSPDGVTATPSLVARALGRKIGDHSSYLYWAQKNGIRVYAPGIVDGALGDALCVFKRHNPLVSLDLLADHSEFSEYVVAQRKVGAIMVGGGLPKHYCLNASVERGGVDYAVHITTATNTDGSDSGEPVEEARSWMQVRPKARAAVVNAEASLVFPLLVAATFGKHYHCGIRRSRKRG